MTLDIAQPALDSARAFFEERGAHGFEGTAMLAGTAAAGITRCVIPHQVARRDALGVCVEVTDRGKLELAGALAGDERYLARIHSHPGPAFHSPADDSNPVLTAQGSFSIVVPFFGLGLRRGLGACAIFRYTGGAWVELSRAEIEGALRVVA